MNDTLKTIAERFAYRNFSDKMISDEDLMAIADAGNQAPTGMNRQHYHIRMVKDKVLIANMEAEGMQIMANLSDKSAHERIKSRGGKMFYNASAIAFIPIKQVDISGMELIDLGVVAQNIALAATSLGIGSCHCRMVSFCFMGARSAEFIKRLQIPDRYKCGYGVLLGYAKEQGRPHTPDKSEIIFIR